MIWIRTGDALSAFAAELARSEALGLDTESDSLYHHRDKVCLLQIATDQGKAVLVDTLVLRDLSPLAPVMAAPRPVKVVHGADYDVTTLKRDFGFTFAGLFDTMIAARLLGRSELGLAAVAREELSVVLTKDNQKDDWSRRPLTPRQEAYALADVQHLVALRERLEPRLAERGRLGWLREECEAVAALEPMARRRDPEAYLKVKGARRLSPRRLAALRELTAWRERRAEETDVPGFKILGSEALLRLAELDPRTERDLATVPGVSPRLRVQAAAILDALRRAREMPDSELPVVPRSPRPVVPVEVARRDDRLRAWRSHKAATLELDASVVLPNRLVERLAELCPRDASGLRSVAGLRAWRIEAFGPELLEALSG